LVEVTPSTGGRRGRRGNRTDSSIGGVRGRRSGVGGWEGCGKQGGGRGKGQSFPLTPIKDDQRPNSSFVVELQLQRHENRGYNSLQKISRYIFFSKYLKFS
jgi:hypothetical protein